jgi:Uma2 family endonuclease
MSRSRMRSQGIEHTPHQSSDDDDDDYVQWAPKLMVEIAASGASYDLHDKPKVYCQMGYRNILFGKWLTIK